MDVNRFFVLSFSRNNNTDSRDSFSDYYVPKVEMKDFNILNDGKHFFDFPVKNEEDTYEKNIDIDNNNITMPMNNLIEYSDNCSDTSGSLWNFKRDEIEGDVDLTIDNAPSFNYKANLIGNTENNGIKNGVKIAIPLISK